jgi:hypothetical protein
MPEPQDVRAQSSPPVDTRRGNRERKHRSPDESHAPKQETDTAAQLISDKLEAAKQHIAKTQPVKKKTGETENGETVAIPPLDTEKATVPPNPKSSSPDMETENLSTVPQAGSPLETVVGPSINSPVKRPSIYKKPFVVGISLK